jgi:glycosyltransferase involved in cell wall biosynthesis
VTALAPADDHSPRLEALGARHLPLAMDNKGTAIGPDALLIARFLATFRRERPDVIFGYTIKNNIYGAIAARALGIPFVPNVTGLGTAFLHEGIVNAVVRRLYRLAFARVPVVFFQNADDRELFVAGRLVSGDRTAVLPGSGIDLRAFAPAPPRRGAGVRFLLIARMLRDKGIGEFVEAARMLRSEHPDAEFVLIGPAGAENRTAIDQATIDGWVAEGVVTHLGAVEDVRPHIADADCVVLPSYREGTPRTLLEAAAMARPVVATDVPGCRQVVDDGETGLLCAVRDAESLAEAMRRMIDLGAEARAAMGAAGRGRWSATTTRRW